jgi:hypothetical protein
LSQPEGRSLMIDLWSRNLREASSCGCRVG